MTTYHAKVSQKKRKEIEEILTLIKDYKVLAIANLEKLPAFNLMKIKSQLRGKIILKFTKKRLIKRAFDESKNEMLISLKSKLEGIPAIMFTNENPFKLFQLLKKSKTPAPAKTGDIAPKEVIIPEGPTEFTPGPVIGELGIMGIKTSVENGKVVIKSSKVLVKEGEKIGSKQADLMSKLGMQPMEVGLNIILTYENGEVLERNILDVDQEVIFAEVQKAISESMALAINLSYITHETTPLLLKKGELEAISLKREYEKSTPPEKIQEEKTVQDITSNEELEREMEKTGQNKTTITEDMMKNAQEVLQDLTDKKIRGEL